MPCPRAATAVRTRTSTRRPPATSSAKDGGSGKASGLATMLMRNMRAGGSEAQAYDDSQWMQQGTEIHRRGVPGARAPKLASPKAPTLLPLPSLVTPDADDVAD